MFAMYFVSPDSSSTSPDISSMRYIYFLYMGPIIVLSPLHWNLSLLMQEMSHFHMLLQMFSNLEFWSVLFYKLLYCIEFLYFTIYCYFTFTVRL